MKPFAFVALFVAALLHTSLQAAQSPNILFILTDDHRWDMMGCAGNKVIQTPNMDSLAREGVRFPNMFVTTAICAASRATILTGLYERTHRYTFGTKPITAKHWSASYPATLKAAGYKTGFVGKFGVSVEESGEKNTFDYFVPLNRNPYFKKQADGSERLLTDIEGDKAIEFLNGCKPGQPFCLSVSFNAPHAEDNDPKQYFWTKEIDNLYKNTTFTPPKTMNPEFINQLPPFLKDSESTVRFKWRFDEPQKYQDMVRGYYRMITDVDRVVGRLRDSLKQNGLADNTIIILTGDNGYFLGDRGFADKWYIYEKSIRVPLLVFDPRAPKTRRGVAEDRTVLNLDLAPTILELTGQTPAKDMQGRSLVSLLRGEKPKEWRTDFLYEHLFERPNIPKSEGVRNERFTYVRWLDSKPLVEELYDHKADFDQMNNLINDPKHKATADQLRNRTTELRDKYGGPFVSNAAPKGETKAKRQEARKKAKDAAK